MFKSDPAPEQPAVESAEAAPQVQPETPPRPAEEPVVARVAAPPAPEPSAVAEPAPAGEAAETSAGAEKEGGFFEKIGEMLKPDPVPEEPAVETAEAAPQQPETPPEPAAEVTVARVDTSAAREPSAVAEPAPAGEAAETSAGAEKEGGFFEKIGEMLKPDPAPETPAPETPAAEVVQAEPSPPPAPEPVATEQAAPEPAAPEPAPEPVAAEPAAPEPAALEPAAEVAEAADESGQESGFFDKLGDLFKTDPATEATESAAAETPQDEDETSVASEPETPAVAVVETNPAREEEQEALSQEPEALSQEQEARREEPVAQSLAADEEKPGDEPGLLNRIAEMFRADDAAETAVVEPAEATPEPPEAETLSSGQQETPPTVEPARVETAQPEPPKSTEVDTAPAEPEPTEQAAQPESTPAEPEPAEQAAEPEAAAAEPEPSETNDAPETAEVTAPEPEALNEAPPAEQPGLLSRLTSWFGGGDEKPAEAAAEPETANSEPPEQSEPQPSEAVRRVAAPAPEPAPEPAAPETAAPVAAPEPEPAAPSTPPQPEPVQATLPPPPTELAAIPTGPDEGGARQVLSPEQVPVVRNPARPPVPMTAAAPLIGVVFELGDSIRLGTAEPPKKGPRRDKCVDKSRWNTLYCIEPVTWPESLAPVFKVNTNYYRGQQAIAQYEVGRATQYHVLFPVKELRRVVDHFKAKYGEPTEMPEIWTALIGEPKRPNRTLLWRSRDAQGRNETILEIREIDDLRWSSPPDVRHGVVRLYAKGQGSVFELLSATDLLLVHLRRRGS